MPTIEEIWWVLFLLNIILTVILLYRNWALREKYHQLEEDLHRDYRRVEKDALDEGQKYMEAREAYDQLIKEYNAGSIPEGD